jgi:Flp pilus assembly protein TadG
MRMLTAFKQMTMRAVARFARAKRGSAAVEFSMLALPFFVLTFGVAEVAMIGLAQTTLDHAMSETSRGIRTGAKQQGNVSYIQVQQELCAEMRTLMTINCSNNLFLDVDTFASFVSVQNNSPISNGNFSQAQFGYNPGTSSSIVVVRAYYRWHVLTPFFQGVFQNVNGGDRILVSTIMFRNEPY